MTFAVSSVVSLGLARIVKLLSPWIDANAIVPLYIGCATLPAFVVANTQDGIARSHDWMRLGLMPQFIVRQSLIIGLTAGAFALGFNLGATAAMLASAAAVWIAMIGQMIVLNRRLSGHVEPGALAHLGGRAIVGQAGEIRKDSGTFRGGEQGVVPRGQALGQKHVTANARPRIEAAGPAHVAPLVVWLASERAAHVNGEVFRAGNGRVNLFRGWHTVGQVGDFRHGLWDPEALGAAMDAAFFKSPPPKQTMEDLMKEMASARK